MLAAGEEIFRIECSACHSVGGVMNDILPLTAHLPLLGMDCQLAGQGKVVEYMPPFMGTADERMAVARYIVEGLHGKAAQEAEFQAKDWVIDIPPFDAENDEYVLLAWNNLGMHCLSDSDPWFVILPPANELQAQLIRRGRNARGGHRGRDHALPGGAGFREPGRATWSSGTTRTRTSGWSWKRTWGCRARASTAPWISWRTTATSRRR